jgi:pimeloyl-ACP methyl ester carboxylesterase
MNTQRTEANGIELAYETFGDPSRPALILVMGLGVQMVGWHEDFCRALAESHYVIRFDNRDTGESQWLEGKVDLAACAAGDTSSAVYTLEDMGDDAVGLLDALGIGPAHVVGASLGGMVAQTIAITHPERVLSLTSIMSTTGAPGISRPTDAATAVLLSPAPRTRDEAMERAVEGRKVLGSPGYPRDEQEIRTRAGMAWDRGVNPEGFARQLGAVWASGDRTEALKALDVPTLVVHGEDDPLIPPDAGRATAAAIPDAELWTIPGMAHDLPRALWPDLIGRIGRLVDTVEQARTA